MKGDDDLHRLLFENSPDAILVFDLVDGRIQDANAAALSMYRCRREEILGSTLYDFSVEPDATRTVLGQLSEGASIRTVSRVFKRKDGSTLIVDGHASAVLIGGRKLGLSINRDNSAVVAAQREQRKAEERLRESQKMEAVGRLAGGIAHDFNNIMTAILGLADFSITALSGNEPVRRDLEEIRRSGQRAATLTRQLLAFSRRQVIIPKVLLLDEAVLGVLKMLGRIIGEQIKVSINPDAAGAWIRADPGQVEQLIMNLVVNARDAMPDGGTLTIKTRVMTLAEASGTPEDSIGAGDYIELTVTDTGTGMAEDVRAHIFEPFYTTKEQGKGTGLGLSICYGIVKQNGGSISCESTPGHGSTFRVLLPRCEPEPETRREVAPPAASKGTERVLVVEDDGAVRGAIVRMLRAGGFEALEAVDGEDGLEALSRDTERRIRLIVSDMVMPRLDGRKMAAAAVVSRPDVRVLIISGYAAEMVGDSTAGVDFLAKPFTADEFLRRVRLALDAAN